MAKLEDKKLEELYDNISGMEQDMSKLDDLTDAENWDQLRLHLQSIATLAVQSQGLLP